MHRFNSEKIIDIRPYLIRKKARNIAELCRKIEDRLQEMEKIISCMETRFDGPPTLSKVEGRHEKNIESVDEGGAA